MRRAVVFFLSTPSPLFFCSHLFPQVSLLRWNNNNNNKNRKQQESRERKVETGGNEAEQTLEIRVLGTGGSRAG